MQEALRLIEEGKADVLVVTKIDRMSRKLTYAVDIAERIDRAGGQIITCDGMEFGKTPAGRLMLNVFASFAEFERDSIRERSERGHLRRAMEGKQPSRSFPPFGFHIVTEADVMSGRFPADMVGQYVEIEEQSKWVREMYQLLAAGSSLRQIEKFLTKHNVPTPKGGKHWYAKTIALIIGNSVYKGSAVFRRTRTYHDESRLEKGYKSDTHVVVRPENEWVIIPIKPLVSIEVWDACQEQLKRNKEMYGGNRGRKFMLSSMVYCPVCGWKMAGANRKHPDRPGWVSPVYLCHNEYGDCNRKCVPTEHLEWAVVQSLLWAAQNPEAISDAIRAYDELRSSQKNRQPADEAIKLKRDLTEVQSEIEATKKMMMTAMRAGLEEKDFLKDFENLAQRRAHIEERLAESNALSSVEPCPEPQTEAEKYAAVIKAIETVLTASDEDFAPTEK